MVADFVFFRPDFAGISCAGLRGAAASDAHHVVLLPMNGDPNERESRFALRPGCATPPPIRHRQRRHRGARRSHGAGRDAREPERSEGALRSWREVHRRADRGLGRAARPNRGQPDPGPETSRRRHAAQARVAGRRGRLLLHEHGMRESLLRGARGAGIRLQEGLSAPRGLRRVEGGGAASGPRTGRTP